MDFSKYEVVIKRDFGEPSEICVHTTGGFKSVFSTLDSQLGSESGVYEIIIRKVED